MLPDLGPTFPPPLDVCPCDCWNGFLWSLGMTLIFFPVFLCPENLPLYPVAYPFSEVRTSHDYALLDLEWWQTSAMGRKLDCKSKKFEWLNCFLYISHDNHLLNSSATSCVPTPLASLFLPVEKYSFPQVPITSNWNLKEYWYSCNPVMFHCPGSHWTFLSLSPGSHLFAFYCKSFESYGTLSKRGKGSWILIIIC